METKELLTFLIEKVELFKGFPQDKLQQLVEGSQDITFEGKEAVVKFGEEGRFMGVLLSGQAEAAVTDNNGQKVTLSLLEAGDVFGEMSLMTGNQTIANIIGITRCEALLIPQNLFSSILISHPQAIRYLSRTITERTTQWANVSTLATEAIEKSDDPYGLRLKTEHPAKILVINCGSSSLKYALFDSTDEMKIIRGSIERIGSDAVKHTCKIGSKSIDVPKPEGMGHREAFQAMAKGLRQKEFGMSPELQEITGVGHRIVHGGDTLSAPTLVNQDVIDAIDRASSFAPLHNKVHIIGIKEAQILFPHIPHVVVFDTGFHNTLPPYAYMYGLPYEYYKQKKLRRYGFHGTSHMYVALRTAQFLKRSFNSLNIISCHLGNGSSICAIDHGRSVDTSMGFTPTAGLIMGTRCGDIDPSILVHLMKTEKMTVDQIEKLINNESGFKGISGISNDMRELERASQQGHHRALLAYKTFCYQIRKFIGSYLAAMGGCDVVIFTGGIGQGSAGVRSLACQGLVVMGIEIDEHKNKAADGFGAITDIATDSSRARILVVPTDEERMIARETIRTVKSTYIEDIISTQKNTGIPIEVSAHHVHLAQEHVELLFGPGHSLTPAHDLSQTGQYACKETVSLVGPKGRVDRVRVLGPTRKETQVEIAMTEQFKLGIHPPIRESGGIENTPGITIEGPKGSVVLTKGVICALRHIHMQPEDALKFGLRDKFKVRVRVQGERELIFGDVLIRINPGFKLAMHIDTDEGNAANIQTGAIGHIEAIQTRD